MGIEAKADICKSCGRTIGPYERAVVVDGNLICFQCEYKPSGAPATVNLRPAQETKPVAAVGAKPVAADRSPFSVDGTKPLARLLDCVVVHAGPSANSEAICGLEAGDVIELHKLWKTEGGWMEIRMPGGFMGYMSSVTKVALLARVKLKAAEADVYEQPAVGGTPTHKLVKGALFWTFPKAPADDPLWVRVRLDSGPQGYIQSSAKLATLARPAVPSVESAAHDILVGAIWCIVGIAVTVGTYSAVAETGGTYFIFYGPVIFGGWQFLKGLFRAASMEQAPVYGRREN